jgi:iron complex outermembrane receptor protein
MKLSSASRLALAAGLLAPCAAGLAHAQTAPAQETIFVLGQIESLTDSDGDSINTTAISAEEMRTFDAASLDEAIDLIPGANMSPTGGSRNEQLIFIRGFERTQITTSIDGVRVFLPADNRIDFSRFLTSDLAEVQVSKGYVSVLNGPGGIGGVVNLVTRKPSEAFEGEIEARATSDADLGYNGYSVSGRAGAKLDKFYAQASGALYDRDSWSLPDDYTPTSLEDGGERNRSDSEDWRINLKAGFTPNDTDEYAISYIKQSGEKNAPLHVTDTANTRHWTWPYWDIESVYFLSRTQLGERFQLRTRLYRNTFDNLLKTYDTAAQTTQTPPRAFDSYYADEAWGGNATLEAEITDSNTLTSAIHYRRDRHEERQDGFTRTPASGNPSVNAPYSEPWQVTEEDTWSFAVEDVQKIGSSIDLIVGASYDWTDLREAADVNVSVTGTTIANSVISYLPVVYPINNMEGWNAQGALVWRATDDVSLHASVSSRIRFPTLFERFSSRFGAAVPNPDIEAERSTNYEIGGKASFGDLDLEGAIFYADLQDALVQVPVTFPAPIGNVNQTRNASEGSFYGFEAAATARPTDWLTVGGNYTWTYRDYTVPGAANGFELTGVPEHKLFAYLEWQALQQLTVTPSVDWASDRWTVTSAAPVSYYETGGRILLNLAADWSVNDHVSLLAGGKNLTDELYSLTDGYPQEGRNFYVALRLRT